MKKIMSLALVAMLAMAPVSASFAQEKEKCKKECCHKCKGGKCCKQECSQKCDAKKSSSNNQQKPA